MSKEKIYPQGLMMFQPREGAPDFVKGKMIISLKEFFQWCKSQEEHYKHYKGANQLQFDILEGRNGLYVSLDTYKKPEPVSQEQFEEPEENLPF